MRKKSKFHERKLSVLLLLLLMVHISVITTGASFIQERSVSLEKKDLITLNNKEIELGDICEVKWNLTLDLNFYNSTQKSYYIGEYIPSTLKSKYSFVKNIWFYEELIGEEVGTYFTFSRSQQWSINNLEPTDDAYGKDILVKGRIIKLVYDSSESKTTLADIPFFNEIIILLIIAASIYVLYRISTALNLRKFVPIGKKCSICSSTESLGRCGKCGTILCRKCFSENNHCPHCNSNVFIPRVK